VRRGTIVAFVVAASIASMRGVDAQRVSEASSTATQSPREAKKAGAIPVRDLAELAK